MKIKKHILLFIIVIFSIQIFINNCCDRHKYAWLKMKKNKELVLKAVINDTLFNLSDFKYYNDSSYELQARSSCYGIAEDTVSFPGPKMKCIIYNKTSYDITIGRPFNTYVIYPYGEEFPAIPVFELKLHHEGILLPDPIEEQIKRDKVIIEDWPPCNIIEETIIKAYDSIIYLVNIDPFFVYQVNDIKTGKYDTEIIFINPCWRDCKPPIWAGELVSNKISFRIVNDN